MQIINKTVKCNECGCVAFPDSKTCPKCGNYLRLNDSKSISPVEINEIINQLARITHEYNYNDIRITIQNNLEVNVAR